MIITFKMLENKTPIISQKTRFMICNITEGKTTYHIFFHIKLQVSEIISSKLVFSNFVNLLMLNFIF